MVLVYVFLFAKFYLVFSRQSLLLDSVAATSVLDTRWQCEFTIYAQTTKRNFFAGLLLNMSTRAAFSFTADPQPGRVLH